MPTTNKRINLTVPEAMYEKIRAFKEENGILSDASACMQLISTQLKAQENTKVMLQAMRQFTPEQLMKLTEDGYDVLHNYDFLPKRD